MVRWDRVDSAHVWGKKKSCGVSNPESRNALGGVGPAFFEEQARRRNRVDQTEKINLWQRAGEKGG